MKKFNYTIKNYFYALGPVYYNNKTEAIKDLKSQGSKITGLYEVKE